MPHPHPMQIALDLARSSAEAGEVPVGAVIVDSKTGEIIASASNRTETDHDATAHAEMIAIRMASTHKSSPRLSDCDMYVTLEPCAMCAAAISFARIRRLHFGAYDPKGGAVEHGPRFFSQPTCHHQPEVIAGTREEECGALLRDFFKEKRA